MTAFGAFVLGKRAQDSAVFTYTAANIEALRKSLRERIVHNTCLHFFVPFLTSLDDAGRCPNFLQLSISRCRRTCCRQQH